MQRYDFELHLLFHYSSFRGQGMNRWETGPRSDQRAKVGVWERSAIPVNTLFFPLPLDDWHGSRAGRWEWCLCISYWVVQL